MKGEERILKHQVMKKGKYLRLENMELNAEIALLAVINLCHVWAPMHEYTNKLGKKNTVVCFIQGRFSVD